MAQVTALSVMGIPGSVNTFLAKPLREGWVRKQAADGVWVEKQAAGGTYVKKQAANGSWVKKQDT